MSIKNNIDDQWSNTYTLKKKEELTQYMLLLCVVVVIANCIAEVWLYT